MQHIFIGYLQWTRYCSIFWECSKEESRVFLSSWNLYSEERDYKTTQLLVLNCKMGKKIMQCKGVDELRMLFSIGFSGKISNEVTWKQNWKKSERKPCNHLLEEHLRKYSKRSSPQAKSVLDKFKEMQGGQCDCSTDSEQEWWELISERCQARSHRIL